MTVVHYRSVPGVTAQPESPAWRLTRFIILLRTWVKRARQRHELADLSDAQLRDVGLNRYMIKHEIEKPFWMA
jgi:uncharacterized protein YjiS (DUF1127 family)